MDACATHISTQELVKDRRDNLHKQITAMMDYALKSPNAQFKYGPMEGGSGTAVCIRSCHVSGAVECLLML
jgi:hypothetical protein